MFRRMNVALVLDLGKRFWTADEALKIPLCTRASLDCRFGA